MSSGLLVPVLGAVGSGKSTLVKELMRVFKSKGLDALAFDVQTLQVPLATEPALRDALAAGRLVLLDVGAACLDGVDVSCWQPDTLLDQREIRLCTLLMSMDLVWLSGVLPEFARQAERDDEALRQVLQKLALPFAVVAGVGRARVDHALAVIEHQLDQAQREMRAAQSPRWRWFCDNCDDGECEQHWLTRSRS